MQLAECVPVGYVTISTLQDLFILAPASMQSCVHRGQMSSVAKGKLTVIKACKLLNGDAAAVMRLAEVAFDFKF
jgi:hypothetical protein